MEPDANTQKLIAKILWIGCLCVAFAPISLAKENFVTGFIQIFSDGSCQINKKPIACDRVPMRLRAMHLSPGFSVLVAVDDAPYEPVAALLDSLERNGIKDVHLMPPFLGTTPSRSVNHWIRLVVDGVVNHPFPMVMISTERFKTWRETLIVLPPPAFEVVDGLATDRIGQADCLKSPVELPMDLRENEHRLLLFEHANDSTRSCLLPRAATSCEFLKGVIGLTDVAWGTGDLEAIRSVAAEIGCNVRN
jgi:hypothetical protein